ncbi:MAG: YceI family protein [Cyclobacteriaceae bacterium]|nr:YceI family protein [Cyclobacteriaceae bacterium HetDA_MAG_MS6]
MKSSIAVLGLLILPIFNGFSQSFTLLKKNSSMYILGSSNLYDWESEVKDFDGEFQRNGDTLLVTLTIVTKSIDSGKEIMNTKTMKALQEERYPEIKLNDGFFLVNEDKISGTGQLLVGGVTKPLSISAQLEQEAGGLFRVFGRLSLKMTDFDIKPPEALMGTLWTADDVMVTFNLQWQESHSTLGTF